MRCHFDKLLSRSQFVLQLRALFVWVIEKLGALWRRKTINIDVPVRFRATKPAVHYPKTWNTIRRNLGVKLSTLTAQLAYLRKVKSWFNGGRFWIQTSLKQEGMERDLHPFSVFSSGLWGDIITYCSNVSLLPLHVEAAERGSETASCYAYFISVCIRLFYDRSRVYFYPSYNLQLRYFRNDKSSHFIRLQVLHSRRFMQMH